MQRQKQFVLVGLFLMELVAAIDITGLTVMVPTLQTVFGIPTEVAGWVLMAYLMPFALFLVPVGWLADRYSIPEKMMVWNTLVFCIASVFCSMVVNKQMLVVLQAAKGIAAAGMFACEFSIILKYWGKEETRRVTEITITGLALGVLIGPVIGGLFSKPHLWRGFFAINVILAIVGFIAYQWLAVLKPLPREADQSEYAGVTGFGLRARLMAKLLFWGLLLDVVISIATQGVSLLVTLEIQEALGRPPLFNSLILSVISLAMIIANVAGIGSRLIPDEERAVVISGLVIATALLILPLTSWVSSICFVLYFVVGLALGVFLSSIELMVLQPLPTSMLAQGNGWTVASMQAGYGVASAIAPVMFVRLGTDWGSCALAALVVCSVVPFLFLKKG